jgi:hypothetical protein
MTAALATAVLSLAGCAAQTRADTDMPAEAFTPEGARRYLAKCRTARDAIQVYGDPERTMKSNTRPSQKGFVWEWVGVRPSFLADKDKRSSRTPTVKRELHVWCGSGGEIVDIEVVGFFYTQVKLPALSPIFAELRALNADELQSLKVPVASGEVLEEYNAYYARQ